MGEVISKITVVQNDSKRIAEDTQSENEPLTLFSSKMWTKSKTPT